jgi:hypothetical protein
MKRRIVLVLCLMSLLGSTPFVITRIEEWRLRDRGRIVAEVGYPIPQDAQIIDTSASIWSLVDGDNYSWTISSTTSLLPWVESLARLEYGRTYRALSTLPDGRLETSYITIAPDTRLATVKTFRP